MLRRYDLPLTGGILFLAAASLLTLASVSPTLFWRQSLWYFLGFLIAIFFSRVDWRWLANRHRLISGFYLLSVTLLVLVYFFAPAVRQVRSWFVFGPFTFQPAELAKLALILIYAQFFSRRHLEASLFRNLFLSFLFLVPPLFLTFIQPDFGSAFVIFTIWVSFVLASGITWRQSIIGVFLFIILVSFLWLSVLQPYQKERIQSFLFPGSDPLGASYSVIQSKIAIGSAGFFGEGFGQGTQVQLGFLPEAGTDFIFAAFVEEWGLLGGLVLLGAFSLVVYRITKIGLKATGNFAKFVCFGAGVVLGLQFLLNVGSNLGFLPVVGLTFPFLSYGGSSLLTLLALIGIIQNISFESSF